ncbi:hypothetical protein [Rhodohalobacter sp. 8-1]|uniref:hypothetical protein n=1 Tax=Rhodohalobacter sp. 8-1 TaxID=3131972 RepID=UPI0030EC2137
MIREENLEDLAWDFIADLFQKNDTGELIVIKDYFENRRVDSMSKGEIKTELRRLVCSKVEDNVFRFYGEKDPSLKKIIRNIKLAVKEHNCKYSVCYENGDLIVDDGKVNNLLRMPSEFMQIKLCSRLTESLMIPDILIEVIDILENQNEYKKRFSLVTLASIIRESFVIIQDSQIDNLDPDVYSKMLQKELDRFLGKSVDRVKDNISRHYIEKGKAEHHEIEIYCQTAKEIVKSNFEGTSGSLSQFEQLKLHYHQLEYEQFRNKHRSVLEYIVKMVREDMLNSFKKDWAHFQHR